MINVQCSSGMNNNRKVPLAALVMLFAWFLFGKLLVAMPINIICQAYSAQPHLHSDPIAHPKFQIPT